MGVFNGNIFGKPNPGSSPTDVHDHFKGPSGHGVDTGHYHDLVKMMGGGDGDPLDGLKHVQIGDPHAGPSNHSTSNLAAQMANSSSKNGNHR